jgi:peptidoglycan/LPS O-acetylase OafA/YrhL
VQSAAIGVTGFVGKIFNFRFLQFVGRISYGIYIYHKPVPYFLKILIGNERMYSILPAFAWVIISLLFTLIIASLSWYIIEKPISRIKEKFI